MFFNRKAERTKNKTTEKEHDSFASREILKITVKDDGNTTSIGIESNGKTHDIVIGWALASAKLLTHMKIPIEVATGFLDEVHRRENERQKKKK